MFYCTIILLELLKPSDADMGVASLCGKSGIGFAIHDNECKNFYVVVEPL